MNTLLYPIYHWTSLKTVVRKNISCHFLSILSISVKVWGNFLLFKMKIKLFITWPYSQNIIFFKTLSVTHYSWKSWVTLSRTFFKTAHLQFSAEKKKLSANLRVVGYSEAQRDNWQNLWMRVSSFYDIFMFL